MRGTARGAATARWRQDTMVAASAVSELAQYSSCEVADALIKLRLPHGGYLPGLELYSPQPMAGATSVCGPAFTVKMVWQSEVHAPRLSKHFMDVAERDSIMLISAPSSARSAVWGGLMTARAQSVGVRGVVIDGRCRDLAEHRDAGFPVFARGHSVLGQSPFTRPSEVQVPLVLADPTVPLDAQGQPVFPPVTVHPGDILLGDVDGVVCVPQPLVGQVVEIARHGRHVDELCRQDLRAGRGMQETLAVRRGT